MLRILLGLDLVDGEGSWNGGQRHVVFIGDLNDRGPDSVAVMDLVMDLEIQALATGGSVTALVGNHEMLAADGDYRFVRAVEVLALERFWYGDSNGLHAVFRGNSPWSRWMRSRPTLVKFDSTLFVHAAVDRWALQMDPDVINTLVSGWMAHFQGMAEAPDESTFWLTTEQDEGPLWSHRYRVDLATKSAMESEKAMVSSVLSHLGTARVVAGHVITRAMGCDIAYPHPVFGDAVAVIDTGISSAFGGRLSALEIDGDIVRPRYFERGDIPLPLTTTLRARSRTRRDAVSAAAQ